MDEFIQISSGQAGSDSLRSFLDWTGERRLFAIGTNSGSAGLPFQGWRRFKEAFAPELIERAVRESNIPVDHIVDPFGGSGTTALAAQFLGINSTTIELNPFLADLIESKLSSYDYTTVVRAFVRVMDHASKNTLKCRNPFPGAPDTFLEPGRDGRFIFSRKVAQRIYSIRTAIGKIRSKKVRRLFRVLLASSAVAASNILVSGKGRRYRKNWADRPIDPKLVDEMFEKNVLAALFDVRRFESRPCKEYQLLRGDARRLLKKVGKADLSVFSPPYPNSFDYTDVYNVELWALGYLSNAAANRRLREATFRSHVQIKRNFDSGDGFSPELVKTIKKLRQVRSDLWNKNIPEMIPAYFHDMRCVLSDLHRQLRPHGRIYLVVGDSRYASVRVPVGKIIAEEAPHLGFKICSAEPFRSMRTSPQQGGKRDLAETLVILERR
jgi:DNA modification methylase